MTEPTEGVLVTPSGRVLLVLDPYILCGGEMAVGVLRADAALLSPLGLSGYVLGQVADALESIGEHELEGAA